jgi:hypothetical protein
MVRRSLRDALAVVLARHEPRSQQASLGHNGRAEQVRVFGKLSGKISTQAAQDLRLGWFTRRRTVDTPLAGRERHRPAT